jgi:type IV pilus assembly protein PilP
MNMRALIVTMAVLIAPAMAWAQTPQGQGAAPAPAPQGRAAAQPPAPAPNAAAAGRQGGAPQLPTTAVTPAGFDYEPEGRRDPFVSLVRRIGTGLATASAATRPAGLAGLETGEVTLRGTIQSQSGFVAILQGTDNRTYIVRPGDRLLDGTVRSITQNAMVILQQVNDPLSLEKQREVRKVLRQTDEAK